jgi:hypothetical protein
MSNITLPLHDSHNGHNKRAWLHFFGDAFAAWASAGRFPAGRH